MMTDTQSPDVAQTGTWCLRLLNGTDSPTTWPIFNEPLRIGRNLGCHVCIDDKRVSRIQCEVTLVDDRPHLRHLSRQTPTLVNGVACFESLLKLGDSIEIVTHRLIVDRAGQPSSLRQSVENAGPTTLNFADSVFLRNDQENRPQEDTPDFAHSVLSLFAFQRKLARCDSYDALVSQIREFVTGKLGPGTCWLAQRLGPETQIALATAVPTNEKNEVPLQILQDAVALEEGVLLPASTGPESNTIAAPLLHGGHAYGAIAIRRDANHGEYTASDLHYLLAVAESAAPLILAAERLEQLRRDRNTFTPGQFGAPRLIGNSSVMLELRENIARLAPGRGNVLLRGETGVGKELVARMIHDSSPRADGPYVTVNCAAIPGELFESEVFGHERGAFTGATQPRKGLFEQAHGGTLFLDEIGELSPTNQARLLRAAETNTFRRLGSEVERSVDVRIVSATNHQLHHDGRTFRPDLFYRLANVVIWIPPLRDRPSDISDLVKHFLSIYSPHAPAKPVEFSGEALEALTAYRWPGNVRELRNVVEQACFTAAYRVIGRNELPQVVTSGAAKLTPGGRNLDDVERSHLVETLKSHDGNVAKSAEALGIAASTLYYKLRRHNIGLKKLE